MTLTVSYTQVVIDSTVIATFEAAPEKVLQLDVYFNCGSPVTIEVAVEDLVNHKIELTPAMINQTDQFSNGVYRVRLRYLDTVVEEDNGLFYIDSGINCAILDLYAQYIDCILEKPCEQNYMFWAFSFHYLLQNLQYCDETSYENACVVYNQLAAIIGEEYDCDCEG